MSTVKFTAQTTVENFYVSSYNNVVNISETAEDTPPADGGGRYPTIVNNANAPRFSDLRYDNEGNQVTGLRRHKFVGQTAFTPTILTTSVNGSPSTLCTATITGKYKIKAQAFASQNNTNFPHTVPIYVGVSDNTGEITIFTENIIISNFTNNGTRSSNNYYATTYANGGSNLPTFTFTVRGSATQGGQTNELVYCNLFVDATKATTSAANGTTGYHSTTIFFEPVSNAYGLALDKPIFEGTITRAWEGNQHIIDGLAGDTKPSITCQSTLLATATLKYSTDNQSPLVNNFTVQEQSQSVITGVQKTLENNFSLSAVGQVKYSISRTLRQETELLGTTFNFRFADPLTITADCSLPSTIALKRGLGANLIIDADATANFTGNMIYDNLDEYSWDDFNILGYAISGYAVAGYVNDISADYSWTELDTVIWDTWPDAVWGGQEASWETWPEDVWASNRTFLSLFTSQQAAKLIASGVSQLLSTTALSDNSAFLKTASSSLRSDFLCDGSPSGIIGAMSTIEPEITVTALVNYIINNAQNINGAFNATLLANYIVKFLWSVSSDFSLAVAPTFKPGGVTNAQCITVVNALANAIYGPSKTLQGAFDPEFIARLFVGTDPYLIHKLLQETRQIFVDAESRGIQIAQEIRLNSIPAEDRDHLVPQETRSMKLRIPPMTNRFTTPKVRTE